MACSVWPLKSENRDMSGIRKNPPKSEKSREFQAYLFEN